MSLSRDELLGLGFRCAFIARSGVGQLVRVRVGYLGRVRVDQLVDHGLAERTLRERFDRRCQMGATLGSEQVHDTGHAFAGLARVGDNLDVGLLERFGLLAADNHVALDTFDSHQVLLVADVAADFFRQNDLRFDGSELHGLLGRCLRFADSLNTLRIPALGFEVAFGDDHRGLLVLFGSHDLLVALDFGRAHFFDALHSHVAFLGLLLLRQNFLACELVGDTDGLVLFGRTFTNGLFGLLALDVDFTLGGDFGHLGCPHVLSNVTSALHLDLRSLLRHDVGDDLTASTVPDVHQFHGLDWFDAPLLELLNDFIREGSAELRTLQHDAVDLVAGEDLADRALHDQVQLFMEFFDRSHTLSGECCIGDAEEGRDIDLERNAVGVVGVVAIERKVEVADRQLDDRDTELRNPARPRVVHVATFKTSAVGHRGATALDNVHHVGAHNLAVEDGETDGKDHQYTD